jgi:lipopolysaccharide export system permease protein
MADLMADKLVAGFLTAGAALPSKLIMPSSATFSFFAFAIEVLPYLWISIFIIMILFAVFNLRHTKTGYRFSLERISNNEIKEKLMSDRITWDTLRKKWTIHDFRIRNLMPGKTGIISGVKIDTTLNLFPKDFQNKHLLHETFTLPELNRHIDLVRSRGADGIEVFLIEKYLRYANPISVIILTIIGFLVSARKSRGGVGFQIALGFSLAFIYILFFMMSKGIAEGGGMPPLLAVWLPNIVFGAVGVGLYYTLPR